MRISSRIMAIRAALADKETYGSGAGHVALRLQT